MNGAFRYRRWVGGERRIVIAVVGQQCLRICHRRAQAAAIGAESLEGAVVEAADVPLDDGAGDDLEIAELGQFGGVEVLVGRTFSHEDRKGLNDSRATNYEEN